MRKYNSELHPHRREDGHHGGVGDDDIIIGYSKERYANSKLSDLRRPENNVKQAHVISRNEGSSNTRTPCSNTNNNNKPHRRYHDSHVPERRDIESHAYNTIEQQQQQRSGPSHNDYVASSHPNYRVPHRGAAEPQKEEVVTAKGAELSHSATTDYKRFKVTLREIEARHSHGNRDLLSLYRRLLFENTMAYESERVKKEQYKLACREANARETALLAHIKHLEAALADGKAADARRYNHRAHAPQGYSNYETAGQPAVNTVINADRSGPAGSASSGLFSKVLKGSHLYAEVPRGSQPQHGEMHAHRPSSSARRQQPAVSAADVSHATTTLDHLEQWLALASSSADPPCDSQQLGVATDKQHAAAYVVPRMPGQTMAAAVLEQVTQSGEISGDIGGDPPRRHTSSNAHTASSPSVGSANQLLNLIKLRSPLQADYTSPKGDSGGGTAFREALSKSQSAEQQQQQQKDTGQRKSTPRGAGNPIEKSSSDTPLLEVLHSDLVPQGLSSRERDGGNENDNVPADHEYGDERPTSDFSAYDAQKDLEEKRMTSSNRLATSGDHRESSIVEVSALADDDSLQRVPHSAPEISALTLATESDGYHHNRQYNEYMQHTDDVSHRTPVAAAGASNPWKQEHASPGPDGAYTDDFDSSSSDCSYAEEPVTAQELLQSIDDDDYDEDDDYESSDY